MDAHMIDSRIFGHQWSTEEGRQLFSESSRVARWLDIVIALAEAQADCGLIPQESAVEIARLRGRELPIADIAERTVKTSHSTLGMIQVLREMLPPSCAEDVYYGATVQDISDTAQVLELRAVGALVWRDLWQLESDLLLLADKFRHTPMSGRTHGQPGSPITFGFKAASWADEIGRHLQRLQDGRKRWLVGQLGGAVGTLSFFDASAMKLRSTFCERLNLLEPDISWINARDRLAEFANFAAMAVSSLARIANEVYALQRQEIGELSERTQPTTVGSITMPHKRNPECSEQVVALARLIRANAAVLTETMVQEHERDARVWKVEWASFPELCQLTLAATAMARELIAGLEVNADAMERNLGCGSATEYLLSEMSARLGKHNAQALLQEAFRRRRDEDRQISDILDGVATAEELEKLSDINIGASGPMIDRVLETAGTRRSWESQSWL